MPQDFKLGKWIKDKYGSQLAFSEKLGVHQTRVSRWLKGQDGVSSDYQAAIRKLGYTGPMPAEEAQDAAAGGPAPYLTREEFAEWRGYWKAGTEELLKRLEALEDQVRKLAPPGGRA